MNPLYKWLISLVAVASVLGGAYLWGHSQAKQAAELADVKAQLALSQVETAKEKTARLADTDAAKAANDRLNQLNSNLDGLQAYVSTLQDANRECLSGADTDRLRKLWSK